MLYDQALFALAYTEAWQATGKDFYRQTTRDIFAYVLRDMTSPEGGFYSAEDADSEGGRRGSSTSGPPPSCARYWARRSSRRFTRCTL